MPGRLGFWATLSSLLCRIPPRSHRRRMELPEVVAARLRAAPRPSWEAILVKACALVAQPHPWLRPCRRKDHSESIAAVAGSDGAIRLIVNPAALRLYEIDILSEASVEPPPQHWFARRRDPSGTFSLNAPGALLPAVQFRAEEETGTLEAELTCDPRLTNEAEAAEALEELERTIRHRLLIELRYCEALDAA